MEIKKEKETKSPEEIITVLAGLQGIPIIRLYRSSTAQPRIIITSQAQDMEDISTEDEAEILYLFLTHCISAGTFHAVVKLWELPKKGRRALHKKLRKKHNFGY